MSETKFTPGPWDAVYSFGVVVKNGVRHPILVNEERKEGESWLEMRLRTEPERANRIIEAEANIALQLAAPKLYEALEEVVDWAGKVAGDCEDDTQAHMEEESIRKAEAALAKARGES